MEQSIAYFIERMVFMGLTLKLLCKAKRPNSTNYEYTGTEPTGTTFTASDFYFREPTDIINPVVVILRFTNNASAPGTNCRMDEFNYCEITYSDYKELNKRYYFITDLVSLSNGKWEVHLHEDVLKTWWHYVKETEQFVNRSQSNVTPTLNDPYAIINGRPTKTVRRILGPSEAAYNGNFIIGLTGCDDGSTGMLFSRGSVKYFAITEQSLSNLIQWLQHLTGTLADQNPIARIVSVMYFPVILPLSATTTTANITFYFTDPSGQVSDQVYAIDCYDSSNIPNIEGVHVAAIKGSYTLPSHPQYDANHEYLNQAPYTTYLFRCGQFGDIIINNDMLKSTNKITYRLLVDLATGQGELQFYNDDLSYEVGGVTIDVEYGFIHSEMAMIGVNIPLTQITSFGRLEVEGIKNQFHRAYLNNFTSIASGVLGGIGDAMTLNIGGGMRASAETAGAIVERELLQNELGLSLYGAGLPSVETRGASGCMLGCYEQWWYYAIFQPVKLPPVEKVGYPYETKATLKNLSGYTKCNTADIHYNSSSICPNLNEVSELQRILTSGFYIN